LISEFLVCKTWSLKSLLVWRSWAPVSVWSLHSFSYFSIQPSLVSFSEAMISCREAIFSVNCFFDTSDCLSRPCFLISKASWVLSRSITFLSRSSISFALFVRVSSFILTTSWSPLHFSTSSPSLISVSCLTLFVKWSFSVVSSRSAAACSYYSRTLVWLIFKDSCSISSFSKSILIVCNSFFNFSILSSLSLASSSWPIIFFLTFWYSAWTSLS